MSCLHDIDCDCVNLHAVLIQVAIEDKRNLDVIRELRLNLGYQIDPFHRRLYHDGPFYDCTDRACAKAAAAYRAATDALGGEQA